MRNKPILAFLYPTPDRDEDAGPFADYQEEASIRRHVKRAWSALNSFLWITHKGEVYRVEEMATPHIFYSLRMLFNHSVPPVFRVLGPGEKMKRYHDVLQWSRTYITQAIEEFKNELDRRGDLESPLKEQYEDIKANARVILALGI